jgi:hypothetical protein
MIARGTLQAATVIAKTTQTDIGDVIGCAGYDRITLFFDYVKGDETGLLIQAHVLWEDDGTEYQDQSWDAAAGTKTVTANELNVTASGNHYATWDVSGVEFIKFTQGGSNNDGTPTGTLAAYYTLKAV